MKGTRALQVPVAVDASGAAQHDAVFKVDRGRLGHTFTVSSVVWYTIDTGLFVTGSFDKTIKVLLSAAASFVQTGTLLSADIWGSTKASSSIRTCPPCRCFWDRRRDMLTCIVTLLMLLCTALSCVPLQCSWGMLPGPRSLNPIMYL